MGVSATEQTGGKRLWEKVFSSDETDNLIANYGSVQSKGGKQEDERTFQLLTF